MDTTQFASTFNLESTGILNSIEEEMMIENGLRAELYKLNVYGALFCLLLLDLRRY
jgi:hypothetical protein